jgi:hypothetical protein
MYICKHTHTSLSLSPSLHRHLQECSEGLKASHWPNASLYLCLLLLLFFGQVGATSLAASQSVPDVQVVYPIQNREHQDDQGLFHAKPSGFTWRQVTPQRPRSHTHGVLGPLHHAAPIGAQRNGALVRRSQLAA